MHFSPTFAGACRFAAVFAYICSLGVPATAQTGLVASENPVRFYYTVDAPVPPPKEVAFTLNGLPATVTATFSSNPNPTGQELFMVQVAGTSVRIGLNRGALSGIPANEYRGTLDIESGEHRMSLPVHLWVGPFSVSLSPANLEFYAEPGDTAPDWQSISINTPTAGETFTASATMDSGAGWLSIDRTTGTIVPGASAITVTVNPTGLAAGTYYGSIRVEVAGKVAFATVELQIGAPAGGLKFNPESLGFVYSTVTQQAPAPHPLRIENRTAFECTVTPESTGNWLKVNGSANATGWLTVPANVTVSVDPADLSAAVHKGVLKVQGKDGSYGTIEVTLVVDSSTRAVSVHPTSLSFEGPSPGEKAIAIATSAEDVVYTARARDPWLKLDQFTGTAPATLYASVDTAGLGNSTYTTYIDLEFAGGASGTHQVHVSYVPASGGGIELAAMPSQVTFTMEQGQSTPLESKQILVTGAPGTVFSVMAWPNTGGDWLKVTPSEGSVPGTVTISVDHSVATSLSDDHGGTVAIGSTTGTVHVGVALNIKENQAVILPNPGSLAFVYDPAAGTAIEPQVVQLTSSDPDETLGYSAGSSASWLRLANQAGTTPAAITASIDVDALPAGGGGAEITVVAGANASITRIPVTVLVKTPPQAIQIHPQNLHFQFTAGEPVIPKTLSITGTTTNFSVDSSRNWLKVNPPSGTAPANVEVTVDASGLGIGNHQARVTVTAGGTATVIPVLVTIAAPEPTDLLIHTVGVFQYRIGDPLPAPKSLSVNSAGGQLQFEVEVASDEGWLSVSPMTGTTPATLEVSADPRGLGEGTYSGTIVVSSPWATRAQSRHVLLTITPNPLLSVSKPRLDFEYRGGGSLPAAQSFSVIGADNAVLPFTAEADQPWIRVTPASGTTTRNLSVSVDPRGLGAGSHSGQITITTGAASLVVLVRLAVTDPLPTIQAITNAASYANGSAAPGEMVVLFGSNLGPPELLQFTVDQNGRVPTELGKVRVLFGGIPAPLVYVRQDQVSAIVPYAFEGGSVWLEYMGKTSNTVEVSKVSVQPGIFTLDASGSGQGAILNSDWSVNTPDNGAAPGEWIAFYVTGEGQTDPEGVDGRVNTDPANLPRPKLPVKVRIGNRDATVIDALAAPGMVSGVMQVNAWIPEDLGPGVHALTVTVGNADSQPGVTVAVKAKEQQ